MPTNQPTHPPGTSDTQKHANLYWSRNIKILSSILVIWFVISYGCGIFFKEELDQFSVLGAPLGFWIAQQGAIITFIVLLMAYMILMNKLDKEFGFDEGGQK